MSLTGLRNRWTSLSRRKRLSVIGVVVAVVAVGGGSAYALWSATGTGSGRARSTSVVAVTVIASDGPQDLYPGFTQGDVFFTLDNTNPFPVTFTSATPGTVTSSSPTCPASNVTVAPAAGLALAVGASTTSAQLSIADIVSMSVDAPDDCQGVSFDIALTLTGTQTP